VESLGGSVIFTVEDGWFYVRALIPIPGPLGIPAAQLPQPERRRVS
jgi:hypothetical protein